MLDYLSSISTSASRIADAVRTGPADAPVRACPGWDVGELGRHMGYIHRWARLAVETCAAPAPGSIEEPPALGALADWITSGAAALTETLVRLGPDAPTWHPFAGERTTVLWSRRQAHETLIHAWDAEEAIGALGGRAPGPLDAEMAADNVAEYFEVMIPRLLVRTGRVAPAGVIGVTCTDTGLRRVVSSDGATLTVDDAATPEAELADGAERLALALWGRRSLSAAPNDPLAVEWLAFGGN